MTSKKVNSQSESWNAQDLIKMSQSLGEAFLPGLDNGKSSQEDDSLTMSKFVAMNKNKDRSKNKPDA
ncbi:hypothetical protein I4641_19455 [Waterburya agarophytonicola K14]|uniref:Uncharacterized protein n=1 Tax=Waterburya agarophytonicola KI4 TaxID=2874699 RepID=A0A964BWT3_9CYAN|nr:hypothetical protein [Waterburya agarophytonicola]MCC0179146.1 hypothetical protein [Waterburya agarophytonicola KI4]